MKEGQGGRQEGTEKGKICRVKEEQGDRKKVRRRVKERYVGGRTNRVTGGRGRGRMR